MNKKKTIRNKTIPLWAVPLRTIYRASLKVMAKGSGLKEIERGGMKYLIWTKEDIGKKLLILRSFEANETEFFKRTIKSGDICLDVGGNIGYFSLNFAKSAGPDGRVYVFEPIERNVLTIRLAAIMNRLNNIEVLESAVADSSGEVSLEIPDDDSAYAHMSTGRADARTATVKCITLDEFIKSKHVKKISVLKVDVEGAEHLVLKGASSLLTDKKIRPSVVMAELVNEFLGRFGSSIRDIIRYMEKFGYKPFYAGKGGKLIPFTEKEEDSIFNVFFIEA